MLIATQGKSVKGTQQYFDQVLTQGDYYLGQEVGGQWRGKGAEILGLGHGSNVTKEEFCNLIAGKHPVSGKRLTQRIRKDRRPGVDLTFSVPKSVSLAWAINDDEQILTALREAVQETMERDVEPLMQRRVRTGKHANTKQKAETGKLVYADFLHKTSRPVEGRPDPHLHIHAFVINWTEQNGKHYAGEFEEIVRQRPSLQAKFEARLAGKLEHDLGYSVCQTRFFQSNRVKAGWEIDGVSRKTIEKFSRRTEQVEEYAAEHGILDADKKGVLGKKTREKKDNGTSVENLQSEWRSRLSREEQRIFDALKNGSSSRGDQTDISPENRAEKSVRFALDHLLQNDSTVERHQAVGTALEHGLTLSPELIEATLDQFELIQRDIDQDGTKRTMVTTREVLDAERRLISFAKDGRGTRKAIGPPIQKYNRDWLNGQQKAAVSHVLTSRDTVMIVTGGAGTGKSSLMQEAAEALKKKDKTVFTFAPSTGAREVLQEKGFDNAQTVEHLIRNTSLHPNLRDQIIWIDEAGLLDVRSLNAVFDIATAQNARVVLSGDTRQHSSPRRGEAMRLIESEAGLNIARVEEIQRQTGKYREAVELVSRGQDVIDERKGVTGLLAGFDRLDAMGKVQEIGDGDRHQILAKQYVDSVGNGKSTLVVAPTHAEANVVTQEIRSLLRDDGKLASTETALTQLRSLNLTEAEKGEPITYTSQVGSIVQFHQNVKGGFKKGDRYRVAGAIGNGVSLISLDGTKEARLPVQTPDRFEVYAEREIGIAAGDKVRFSLGGKAADGTTRISNGRLDEVREIDADGNLVLKGGTVIDKNYGHLGLGYVVTSHASQGKDRHLAIAAMGSQSLPAINAKQFYVTVSRGRKDVMIYVDDKARVRRAIERSGEQLSATELIQSAKAETQLHDVAETRQPEYWRRSRQAFHAFRDRVSRWWNGETIDRRADHVESPPREIGLDLAQSFGLNTGPELGRSRS